MRTSHAKYAFPKFMKLKFRYRVLLKKSYEPSMIK